jgi:signal transduction histidine kinase
MDFEMNASLAPESPASAFVRNRKRHPEIAASAIFCFQKWPFVVLFAFGVMIFSNSGNTAIAQSSIQAEQSQSMITNALQLRRLAASEKFLSCQIRLEGWAVWVSSARDQFIFQDDSGATILNFDFHDHPSLNAGQKVRLQANCLVGRGQAICTALIDNDGDHSIREKSGSIFLSKGKHPIRVEWFNDLGTYALAVEWAGPGILRQPIPDGSLFRTRQDLADGGSHMAPGLNYRCYEGKWGNLPNFTRLPVKKQGATGNFDLSVRTRIEEVGIVFDGYIEVPQNGSYTFWTKSDDGSRLFIDNPTVQLDVLGPAKLPPSQIMQIIPGQSVTAEHSYQLVEAEGTVTFVNSVASGIGLELTSGQDRLPLEVPEATFDSLKVLQGCQIQATGILQPAFTFARQNQFSLLVPDLQQIHILQASPTRWADCPITPIHLLSGKNSTNTIPVMVHISGTVYSNSTEPFLIIKDTTGDICVNTKQAIPQTGEEVEALGWLTHAGGDWVVADASFKKCTSKTNDNSATLSLITQAIQAKNLVRTEAKRGYPIRIRGVITARIVGGFTIQDPTWSIFFKLNDGSSPRLPKIGEYWEITGKTTNIFAPSILVDDAVYLGKGVLPEPVQPSWDEVINGSLDTQYIELQGVATMVRTNGQANNLVLFTRAGKIMLELYDLDPQMLKGLEDAVIRIRGVISPTRNEFQQVVVANLRLFNASINVEEPAPADPFAIPVKRVSDLLFFDPHANALHRIQIAGQVVCSRDGVYFLMDGDYGLRFQTKFREELQIGDLVKIVGFPDLSGSAPALRECLVQRTGRTALPKVRQLPGEALLDGRFDATLVRIQATLVDSSANSIEQVFELQAGNRGFTARLEKNDGLATDVLPGSRLDMVGVYAGQGGGGWASSRDIDSFELLLNSASDVRVLARPSWWTVQHTLTVLGGMAFVILAAFVWIIGLRRQVEERTKRLAVEIQRREQIEHQRALEAERARIAQDLHDDLGATLTQIRFLSAIESADSLVPQPTRERLSQVSEKSRQMVTTLDEIVWAVNPANDSMRSLAHYLRHMAADYFRATTINCRFDVDKSLPLLSLNSEVRHNLFLTVREALNNSAKHSHATELWLRIHWRENILRIIIEDNGCGFASQPALAGGNGLANMRQRMEKIGGSFVCDTRPDSGTIYRLILPFV